jgi:HK97 family phage prohead protease
MEILTDNDEWQGGLLLGLPVEFKLLDTGADTGAIEGYGATFDNVDYGGDTIAPGAFTDTLAEHRQAGTAPAMLWNHRSSEPTGKWTGMGEDHRGLRVRGQLNLNTAAGRKAHEHLKAGDVSTLSIGYQVPPGGMTRGRNGTRTLNRVKLHEVSLAPVAMDPHARVTAVKSLGSASDLEELLRETGVAKSAARKIVAGGWPALSGEPVADPNLALLMKQLDAGLLDLKALNQNLNRKGLRR